MGGGVVRGGSADITACQGDISFAMNHGPVEGLVGEHDDNILFFH